MKQYCAEPCDLVTLPDEAREKVRDLLTKSFQATASIGVLQLLCLLTPFPETQLASPADMVEWFGLALLRGDDGLAYVEGRLRNIEQQGGRRRRRESDYAREQAQRASALQRLESLDSWRLLSPLDQQHIRDALSTPSQAELATKWGVSLEGTKKRLTRLRNKIEELEK